jgi:hypothetical protein
LAALVDRGALTVVGAVYSLDTGKVAWLPNGTPKTVGRVEAPRESAWCVGSRGTGIN